MRNAHARETRTRKGAGRGSRIEFEGAGVYGVDVQIAEVNALPAHAHLPNAVRLT